jgi:pimeloyl-ACP methyl ester carboxylesterase
VILLLPGGIFDARIWLYTHALTEQFNVYALDWPDNHLAYSGRVENYGEIASDFLSALEIEELFVAGVSAGSYAAVDLASRKTELRIKALFLFSTVMFAVDEEEAEERIGMASKAFIFSPQRLRAVVEWQVGRTEFDEAPGEHQQTDIFWVRPYSYYYQIFSMARNQGAKRQQTDKITCPVLFLLGADDEIMALEKARLNRTIFPNAHPLEVREFPGGKHSMVFSQGPEMVQAMVEFLRKHDLV